MNFRILKLKLLKTGRERYEVRAWDGTGDLRIEWRRRFGSRTEAQDFVDDHIFKEREAKLKIKRNGADPMTTRTFAEEYEFWSKCKMPDLSPSYQMDVKAYWREVEPKLGTKVLIDIRPQLIREIEADFKVNGNSQATIKRKIVWLKSILNFAVENERIQFNPIAKLKTAKPAKADLQFWEAAEASSFLAFALSKYPRESADEQVFLAYLTSLNTALRAGELWALKPSCLKVSLQQITITEQFDLRAKCFRKLKGREARNVPLQPALAKLLLDYIERKGIGPNEVIFSSARGTPMDHNNFKNRHFSRDVAAWGGREIVFHGLRHTAATVMLDVGVDIRTVQEVLGHKDLQTTMRYVHAIGKNVRRASLAFSIGAEVDVEIPPTEPLVPGLRLVNGT